jgi:hypothetical protein
LRKTAAKGFDGSGGGFCSICFLFWKMVPKIKEKHPFFLFSSVSFSA